MSQVASEGRRPFCRLRGEETYTLKLMDLVLSLVDEPTPESVVSKLEAEEPKLAAGLKPKDHQDRFERAAALGVISCRDSLASGVAAYYRRLLPSRDEKKRYVVRAAAEAERQPMDRKYGDPAFYAECLKPLEDELDAVSARISSAMSDRDVEELSEKWLSAFRDVGYTIQRMRTHYLERRAFGR